MRGEVRGALAGGGIVAAVALASAFIGGLDKLGVATDAELQERPTKEEIVALLKPIQDQLAEIKRDARGRDDRLLGISTNLASFQGAWIEWKENQ